MPSLPRHQEDAFAGNSRYGTTTFVSPFKEDPNGPASSAAEHV
jgi:hypothetical protein